MIVQYYKLSSKFHHRPHIICLCVNDVKWWTQHMCPLIKGWALLGGGKGSRFEGHVIIISSSVSLHIISKDQESQDCLTVICLLHQRRWSSHLDLPSLGRWSSLMRALIKAAPGERILWQPAERNQKDSPDFTLTLICFDLDLLPPISREPRLSSNWCKT